MKKIFVIIIAVISVSCGRGPQHKDVDAGTTKDQPAIAEEVLQTSNYTYLLLKKGNISQWVAVPKMDAAVGDSYFYEGGGEMKDFKSKELDRTFSSILFLQGVSSMDPGADTKTVSPAVNPNSKTKEGKLDIKIDPVSGGITIGELFSNRAKYDGETVMIKGQVTKLNSNIMGKNWVHLQDGTDFTGEFDLTATTGMDVKKGEIVTIQGKIALDKDFGHGYFYKVIMEEAIIIK